MKTIILEYESLMILYVTKSISNKGMIKFTKFFHYHFEGNIYEGVV